MRNFRKSLLTAAAMAMLLLVAGSAGASSLSIRQQGTNLDNIVLAAPGNVVVEVLLTATSEGVAVLEFTVEGSAGNTAMSGTTGSLGTLAEFSPPTVAGNTVLFTLATFAAGPTSGSGVVGTATFFVGQSGTIHIQPFFYSDNANNEFPGQNATNMITVTIVPVPEPGTLLLLGSGLVGLAILGRRQR